MTLLVYQTVPNWLYFKKLYGSCESATLVPVSLPPLLQTYDSTGLLCEMTETSDEAGASTVQYVPLFAGQIYQSPSAGLYGWVEQESPSTAILRTG